MVGWPLWEEILVRECSGDSVGVIESSREGECMVAEETVVQREKGAMKEARLGCGVKATESNLVEPKLC